MSLQKSDIFKVCKTSDLIENKGQKHFVDDEEIAVFKIEGNFYAFENVCPHQHASIMHNGFVEDGCLVCPAHGWKFNINDGKKDSNLNGLRKHEAIIKDEFVFVKLKRKKSSW